MTKEKISILIDGSGSFASKPSISSNLRSPMGCALQGVLNVTKKTGKPVNAFIYGSVEPIVNLQISSFNPPAVNKAVADSLEASGGLLGGTSLNPTVEYARTKDDCDHLIIVGDGDVHDAYNVQKSLASFTITPSKRITFVLSPPSSPSFSLYSTNLEKSSLANIAKELKAGGRNNVETVFCKAEDLTQALEDIVEGKHAPARTADNELSELRKAFEEMGRRLEALEKKQQPDPPSSQWYTPYKPNGFDKK